MLKSTQILLRKTSLSQAVAAPLGAAVIRYRLRFQAEGAAFPRFQLTPVTLHSTGPVLSYTVTGLTRATKYTVDVKMEFRYSDCFTYLAGNYSEPIKVTTNDTGEDKINMAQL